jgi:molybdopterin/thiamine biosynthesis adenylyltransferase
MESYFLEFLARSVPLLTQDGIKKLSETTIAVAGVGGVGGIYTSLMARLGVGNFLLADPENFEKTDINRQWGASLDTLGKKKVDVYENILTSINPYINVVKYPEGILHENVEEFVQQADLMADCLDISVDIEVRKKVYEGSRRKGIHTITFPMIGFGGMCVTSSPEGMSMGTFVQLLAQGTGGIFPESLKKIFVSEHLRIIETMIATEFVPSLAIAPTVTACLASTESLLILIKEFLPGGRTPVVLPEIIITDLFNRQYRIEDIRKIAASQ